MSVDTIKKLVTDRGFAFDKTDRGDLFFHTSADHDVQFEELRQGQSVEYTEARGPKGPRAGNAKPV